MAVQIRFTGGQTQNLASEYEQRKKYIEYVRDSGLGFIDTLYEDKHYGFLNDKYEIVYPNPSSAVNFPAPAAQVQTLNYVATQFSSFRQDFLTAAQNLDYITVPNSISSLTPTKGYVNMDEDYQTYQELTIEKILLSLNNTLEDIPVNDYDMFIEKVNNIILNQEDLENPYKITRSGFLLSRSSIPYYTGLYINLASDLSTNLDLEKGKMIQYPGFKCYVAYANKHGFYIDANAPWRMVLNLNSEVTRKNIVNEKDRNFNDFYSNIYRAKAGYDDYHDLKSFYERVFLFYNLRKNRTFDPASVFVNYNTDLLLNSFVLIRMLEIGAISKKDLEEDTNPSHIFLLNTQAQAKMRFRGLYKFRPGRQNAARFRAQTAVTGNHGLSGFMNQICAQFLKIKLMKYTSNFQLPPIDIQTRVAEDFTANSSTLEAHRRAIQRARERMRHRSRNII